MYYRAGNDWVLAKAYDDSSQHARDPHPHSKKVSALAVGLRTSIDAATTDHQTRGKVYRIAETLESVFRNRNEQEYATSCITYLGLVEGGAALEVRVRNAGTPEAVGKSYKALRSIADQAKRRYYLSPKSEDNLISVVSSEDRSRILQQ